MRRMITLLMVLCLLPLSALAERMSIQALNASAPDYWDGSCVIGGENVPFHAPVYVPDVEKLPVVRAARMLLTDEDVEGYLFKAEGQRIECQPQESSITSSKTSWTQEFLYSTWQEDVDPYTIYAENAGFSLGEAVDGLRAYVKQLYGDEVDIVPNRVTRYSAWREAGRQKAPTEHDPYTQRGSLTGLGSLSIETWTTVYGVPVLAGISHSLHDQTLVRHSKLKEALHGGLYLQGMRLYFAHENCWTVAAWNVYGNPEVLVEDIPLLPFEEIQRVVQQKIDGGEICHVYSMQLGYVVCADPDVKYPKDREGIDALPKRLVPMWVVEVSRTRSSSTGRDTSSYPGAEEGTPFNNTGKDWGYELLFIDAQTGEVLNKKISKPNDALLYAREVETW